MGEAQLPSHRIRTDDCKNAKKKCDKILPSCSRCGRLGLLCKYRLIALIDKTSSSLVTNELINASELQLRAQLQDMTNRLEATQSALLEANATLANYQANNNIFGNPVSANPTLTIEDPDLMPSLGDMVVVMQYFRDPNLLAQFLLYPRAVVGNFFTENTSLRLIICAIAANFQIPRLPNKVCIEYYSRARKSIKKYGNIVSLKHTQALMFHSLPTLAHPFFAKAAGMARILQLDIDPDNNPRFINISEDEKEERRNIFWFIYYSFKIVQICHLRNFTLSSPSSANVKYCHQYKKFSDSGIDSIYPEIATSCYASKILDLILDAKDYCITPPYEVYDLLGSRKFHLIISHLLELKQSIPSHRLLSISTENNSLAQFMASWPHYPEKIFDKLFLTIYYNAAICMVHRPTLYLTKFLPLTSPYLMQNADAITIILNALGTSMNAAQTIVSFASWLVHLSDSGHDGDGGLLQHKIWREHTFGTFALFEAVVVLWFALCHTQRFWWRTDADSLSGSDEFAGESLRMGIKDRRRIRSQVLDVLRSFKELEGIFGGVGKNGSTIDGMISENEKEERENSLPNMLTPMVAAIEAMVIEMEASETRMTDKSIGKLEAALQGITLGMRVIGIEDDDVNIPSEIEPWAFLGLLGMEVGGMHWFSRHELPWRLFWSNLTS
ncbi:hypothetical protein HK100_006043 [Physocladia obscura]|uniref:Zn(2)-C6 fungal-type domain-containing protein n=1 Tax=Physocladia obscura TaxID=109957 RepID=A0AAD5SQT6_9FUNG|nr:hypothetical protein HK100_006043 [Physocladia obscura]